MSSLRPATSTSSRVSGWIVFVMLAMLAVPAGLTLHVVRAPAALSIPPNATPYGYTVSLLLFLIPIAVIAGISGTAPGLLTSPST